ncbi:hypothetical protein ACHAWC_001071 [Mediolabrus comicus]
MSLLSHITNYYSHPYISKLCNMDSRCYIIPSILASMLDTIGY